MSVHVVGGRVRDAIMGRTTTDTDIVVPRGAVSAARLIAASTGGRCVVLDEARDVARVLWPPDRVSLDVAAWAGSSLVEDLSARDYTVNAMAVPLDAPAIVAAVVIDPTGGLADLANRRVRLVTEAALEADPLRLLRGPRVAAELGFHLDAQTEAAIRRHAWRAGEPAGERVRDELFRLLGAADVPGAVAMIDRLGISVALDLEPGDRLAIAAMALWTSPPPRVDSGSRVGPGNDADLGAVRVSVRDPLPELRAELAAHFAATTSGGRTVGTLALLVTLIANKSAAGAGAMCRSLRLSAAEIRRVERIWAARAMWPVLAGTVSPVRAAHRLFRAAGGAGVDALMLEIALCDPRDRDPEAVRTQVSAVAAALRAWFRDRGALLPPPLIDGSEVIEITGLPPGPWLRRTLAAVHEAQAAGEVKNRVAALAMARRIADDSVADLSRQ